jgi:ribose 1,5-bisphosphokinase
MAHDMSGILLYVIGPSGCGKDSLMGCARKLLANDASVIFAHRYITRPHDAGGENHIALSELEFEARAARNLFSLHWQSHGLRYGIGCEINQWLENNMTVVLNGSRAYLEQASSIYPELVPVLIEVSPEVLCARLHERGRESKPDIRARLLRAHEFKKMCHPRMLVFSNNAPLEKTGPDFAELVRSQAKVLV